uniref:Uncharacterized protein n=1 Tax=Rhizophagus irregularis (strain DAOM 181602 / DAOM 197198 / MUCL 43194) TaxID=747089 RepID=U9UHS9_RHIID
MILEFLLFRLSDLEFIFVGQFISISGLESLFCRFQLSVLGRLIYRFQLHVGYIGFGFRFLGVGYIGIEYIGKVSE